MAGFRMRPEEREALDKLEQSRGIENVISAKDLAESSMIGDKRAAAEKAAKATQRALERYKAIKEAREAEDEAFMNEFGMSIDEAKHYFKMSKGELRDLTNSNIPDSTKSEEGPSVQTTIKKVTTRTDGELPETTVEEVEALNPDVEFVPDVSAEASAIENAVDAANELENYNVSKHSDISDTQMPFAELESDFRDFEKELSKYSSIVPYKYKDAFMNANATDKAKIIMGYFDISPAALLKKLKTESTNNNIANALKGRYM